MIMNMRKLAVELFAALFAAFICMSCTETPGAAPAPDYDIVPTLSAQPSGLNAYDAATGILSVKSSGVMTGDIVFADSKGQDVSDVTFKANVPAENKLWCTAAFNKSRLILTVSKNTSDSPRQTTVRIAADLNGEAVGDYTLTIIQDAAGAVTPDNPQPQAGPEITHFLIAGMIGSAVIDYPTITVTMPAGTDISALTPTILVTSGATVTPASGVPQDFSQVVEYTVTDAENKESRKYYVVVTLKAASSDGLEPETNPLYTPFEMVEVGAGYFMLGEDPSGKWQNETNTHKVNVSAFEIGKYEVTQKEFLEVMGYNPSVNDDNELYPVHKVTLYEAMNYCNKLSLKKGYTPVYTFSEELWDETHTELLEAEVTWDKTANGYRLPTNAEWEYAAKGGPSNRDYPYHFPGGDVLDEVAWNRENSAPGPNADMMIHVVGLLKPNSLGIYDMAGNAEEWTGEWYLQLDYLSDAEETDPWGPDSYRDAYRYVIVRGGAFDSYDNTCCVTQWRMAGAHVKTDMLEPGGEIWWDQLGFRIVRSLK